jgi:hypothetical protein
VCVCGVGGGGLAQNVVHLNSAASEPILLLDATCRLVAPGRMFGHVPLCWYYLSACLNFDPLLLFCQLLDQHQHLRS